MKPSFNQHTSAFSALKDHDIHQDHGGLLENTKGDIKSRLGFTASEISGDLRGRIGWTVTSWAGGDQTDSCDRNNTSRCDLRSRLGWARSTSPCNCKCDTDDESSNVKSRLGYCDISSDEDNIASCVDEDRWAQVCDRKSYAKPRISGSPRRIPVLISTRLVEGRKRKYSGRGEIESGNEHCHCCKCAQTEKTRDRAVQSESDLNKLIVLTPMEDLKTQDKYVAKKENIKIKVNLNSEDDDDSDVEIIYEDDKMTHVTNCCQRDTESSQKRKRSTSHRERSKKDCDSDRRHNRGRSEYSDHRRRREDSGNRRREIGNNDKLYEKAPTYSSKHQDKGHHKAFSYKPIVFSEKKGKSSQSHREDHKRKHSEERDVKPLKKKCVESTTRSRSVHPSVLKKAKRNRHSVSPIIILDSDEEQIGRTDTAGHSGGNSKKTPKGLRISSDLEDDLGSEPEIDLLEECNQIVDNNNSKDLHRSKDGNFVTNSHHQTPSENEILDFQKTETGKSLKNENASCSSVLEYVRENVHGKNSPSLISSTSENCDFKIVPSVAPTNYKTPSEPLQSSEMGTDSTAPSAEFSLATAKWVQMIYHQISNIRHTKSQNLTVSRLVLQLSLPHPLKPGVNRQEWRCGWSSGDRRCSD